MSKKIQLRQVKNWQMDLAIARNPFTDQAHQDALPNLLREQEAKLDPISQKPAKLDKAGVARLKSMLSKSGKVRAGG